MRLASIRKALKDFVMPPELEIFGLKITPEFIKELKELHASVKGNSIYVTPKWSNDWEKLVHMCVNAAPVFIAEIEKNQSLLESPTEFWSNLKSKNIELHDAIACAAPLQADRWSYRDGAKKWERGIGGLASVIDDREYGYSRYLAFAVKVPDPLGVDDTYIGKYQSLRNAMEACDKYLREAGYALDGGIPSEIE